MTTCGICVKPYTCHIVKTWIFVFLVKILSCPFFEDDNKQDELVVLKYLWRVHVLIFLPSPNRTVSCYGNLHPLLAIFLVELPTASFINLWVVVLQSLR